MPSVLDEFLDVDFTKDPRYVPGDLGVRAFGEAMRAYGEVVPEIPEAQWQAKADLLEAAGGGADEYVTRIYDQKSEGSCVANACAQALEIIQALKFGKDKVVPLSAISLYKRIGRSPGSGAMVSDGLDELVDRGILPLDTPENKTRFAATMPATGFYTPYPAGWEAVAKRFRVTEFFLIRTVAQLITALLMQHPVVVGRSGHSICYTRPVYRSGKLTVKYANSWSPDWGEQGFGYDSLSMIRSSASWAFAIRSMTVTL